MSSEHAPRPEPPPGDGRRQVVRDLLEHALDTLAASIYVTDASGQIVYANTAALEFMQVRSKDDLLDARLRDVADRFLVLDEDGVTVPSSEIPSLQVAAGAAESERLLRIIERERGDERWRLIRSKALIDAHGDRFAVTVTEDVTAVKEAELRQAFIARAGELLSSSLDYEQTLQRVAELAVPKLADWCAVDVVDDRGERSRLVVVHQDPDKVAFVRALEREYPADPRSDRGVYGVLRSGRPQLWPVLPDELLEEVSVDERHLGLLRSIGMRAIMIVPMAVRGRTIGAITLVSSESRRTFDEEDLDFAGQLARHAAIAVENARLYTSRDEAAQTLQQSLLPERLTRPSGWLSASSYRPGDDINEVGGDFYDVIEVPDSGWLAFIGDVTGKGVPAAALTSLARHTLQAGARYEQRPSALMRLLEDVLAERDDAAPVTVACVRSIPHPDGAAVFVTLAGHPPPLLLRPDAEPELIGVADVLLGAGVGVSWRETAAFLRPGDTLLLYTDGVIDTPGTQTRFGEQRLAEVAGRGPLDPVRLLARVDEAVTAWQSGRSLDDRAMIALQLDPAGAVPARPLAAGGAHTA